MASLVANPVAYKPARSLSAPYQPEVSFPLALELSKDGTSTAELTDTIRGLAANGTIRKLLDAHGAIYFNNLGLTSPDDFSDFAHSFGWLPHEDIGNPVRRTLLARNVATANEGPNTQPVYPHNEFGLSPHYPAYVFFYCVYDMRQGVKYHLFYPNAPRNQTDSPGTSVLQAYGPQVLDDDDTETARKKIEREIRRLPTASWTWENQSDKNPLGDLRVWQVLPAVRQHEQTGHPAFFNNVVSRFLNAVSAGSLLPPHINNDGQYQPPAFYGDGSLIPREYLDYAVAVIHETRALVTWRPGDVLLLDNHAVQHAREPWTG
ncbi:uncharacterized protein B0I36DRAFT_243103 [Microdochium trichocladiopsis]|uniref:TauD/TfdA-like domain-containing protein n=1 Tax=Microdochium trichocladiopsis TaxID=1682393 RepID=A0A9P8YA64_9PEZI|nr:uncharacterized protein B0I36DRAFT_243103 [Microdochium trichocladiopsis]KAH7031485.1 hypothetical protein B0I36DRAFT_243103 [Microdochium trichocladiopsis]